MLKSERTKKSYCLLELRLNVGQKIKQASCKFCPILWNIQIMTHWSIYSFKSVFVDLKKRKVAKVFLFNVLTLDYDRLEGHENVCLTGPFLAVYCMRLSHAITCSFSKYFKNFVYFCPNFQIFCPFLTFICPFFALFLKNRTHALTF